MASRLARQGRRPPPLDLNNARPYKIEFGRQVNYPIQEYMQPIVLQYSEPTPTCGPYLGRRPAPLNLKRPKPRERVSVFRGTRTKQSTLQRVFHANHYTAATLDNRRRPPIWDLAHATRAEKKHFSKGKHPMMDELSRGACSAPIIVDKHPFLSTPVYHCYGHGFPKTAGHTFGHQITKELPNMGFVVYNTPGLPTIKSPQVVEISQHAAVAVEKLKVWLADFKVNVSRQGRNLQLMMKERCAHVIELIMEHADGGENPHRLMEPHEDLFTNKLNGP